MNLFAGRYKIDIQVAGSQLEGSPFYVDVFDLNSIRIDNFRHGIVGEPARFSGNYNLQYKLSQIFVFPPPKAKGNMEMVFVHPCFLSTFVQSITPESI